MKRASIKAIQIFLLSGLACAGMARAGLVLEPKTAAQPEKPAAVGAAGTEKTPASKNGRRQLDLTRRLMSNIEQVGSAPSTIPVVKGMGSNVTLIDAIRQLLPAGWTPYVEGEFDQDLRVDWVGNRPWTQIVNSVLSASGNQAVIDWGRREITITPLKPSEVTKSATPAAPVLTQAPSKPSPVPAAPAAPSWRMNHGPMIKENLEAWAKSINWTVEWTARSGDEIYDYPASPFEQTVFTGELMGPKGVFARVIAAFADSEPALGVEFFPANKRVEVSIYKKYIEQGVESGLADETRRAANGK